MRRRCRTGFSHVPCAARCAPFPAPFARAGTAGVINRNAWRHTRPGRLCAGLRNVSLVYCSLAHAPRRTSARATRSGRAASGAAGGPRPASVRRPKTAPRLSLLGSYHHKQISTSLSPYVTILILLRWHRGTRARGGGRGLIPTGHVPRGLSAALVSVRACVSRALYCSECMCLLGFWGYQTTLSKCWHLRKPVCV